MAQSSPTTYLHSHEALKLQPEEIRNNIVRHIVMPVVRIAVHFSDRVWNFFVLSYIGDGRLDKVGFDSVLSDSGSVLCSRLRCWIRLHTLDTASLSFFNYTKIPVIFQSMYLRAAEEFALKCEIHLQLALLLTYLFRDSNLIYKQKFCSLFLEIDPIM